MSKGSEGKNKGGGFDAVALILFSSVKNRTLQNYEFNNNNKNKKIEGKK